MMKATLKAMTSKSAERTFVEVFRQIGKLDEILIWDTYVILLCEYLFT